MAPSVDAVERMNGTGGSHAADPVEVSPKVSPYATRAVAIRVGQSGVNYTIPEAIIGQYPTLKDKIRADSPYAPIDLRQVDENVGHTLVHFLFTGEYQTLGLDVLPGDRKASAEFETCVLAYCAARLCGIDALADLTQVKMDEFGPQLSVADILHAMEEVAPKLPVKEQRLPLQMQSWLQSKLQADTTYFTEGRLLQLTGRSAVFDTAVAKAVIKLHASALANRTSLDKSIGPAASNGITSDGNSEETLTSPSEARDEISSPANKQPGGETPTIRSDSSVAQETSSDAGGAETLTTNGQNDVNGGAHNANNGSLATSDNIRLTDDEGDAAKTKASKKSKKKKARKDSIVGVGAA